MAHVVTCIHCKKKFDRDIIPFVEVGGNRYIHLACRDAFYSGKTQAEIDLEALHNYIKKLLDQRVLNQKVIRQIHEYRSSYGYSYSGMLKTLKWWYEIEGNKVDKANNGIGIIPYIYKDALDYYYKLYLAEELNKGKNFEVQTLEVNITPPQRKTKERKMFDITPIESEEVNNGK